jgi:hypothetical protein
LEKSFNDQVPQRREIVKLSTLFIINAVVALLFGLAFLLAPASMAEVYGLEADAGSDYVQGAEFIGRFAGVAFIGFAVIAWQARYSADSTARRAIVLAFFVSFALGFIVSVIAQFQEVYNALGWSTVVIYLLFALGYGYFQFMGEDKG